METDPRPLAPGLWALGNPHILLFLARGTSASALIEVGVSATVPAVLRQLDALGVEPDVLVVTHPHSDHVTGLDGLRARYPRAEVVAARGAAEFLAHPRAAQGLVAEDRHMAGWLEARGTARGPGPVTAPPSLEGARIVRDGEAIDLGGLTLRFLEASGHSPGSLAVHVPERGALFPSDALGFRYPTGAICPLFFTGLADYLVTLDRLESLAPGLLGPGHQALFTSGQTVAALREARAAALALAGEVQRRRDEGGKLEDALFHRVYVDEMTLYTPANVRSCVRLLIRRSLEANGGRS